MSPKSYIALQQQIILLDTLPSFFVRRSCVFLKTWYTATVKIINTRDARHKELKSKLFLSNTTSLWMVGRGCVCSPPLRRPICYVVKWLKSQCDVDGQNNNIHVWNSFEKLSSTVRFGTFVLPYTVVSSCWGYEGRCKMIHNIREKKHGRTLLAKHNVTKVVSSYSRLQRSNSKSFK